MYGLVQAGIIAHETLKEHLKNYSCAPKKITQVLWRYQYRDINLTLVVDNFVIKFRDKKQTNRLIGSLQAKYEVTRDWMGWLYLIITLKLGYAAMLLGI